MLLICIFSAVLMDISPKQQLYTGSIVWKLLSTYGRFHNAFGTMKASSDGGNFEVSFR